MSETGRSAVGEGHEIEVTRVFEAWTKGEPLKNWFAPAGFAVPEVESDPTEGDPRKSASRAGICLVFRSQGTYNEVVPP